MVFLLLRSLLAVVYNPSVIWPLPTASWYRSPANPSCSRHTVFFRFRRQAKLPTLEHLHLLFSPRGMLFSLITRLAPCHSDLKLNVTTSKSLSLISPLIPSKWAALGQIESSMSSIEGQIEPRLYSWDTLGFPSVWPHSHCFYFHYAVT